MIKANILPILSLLLVFLWVLGCNAFDRKAPTKSNFRAAIQDALNEKPRCLITLVPKDIPSDGKQLRADTELEPYLAAGLVNRAEAQVDARQDWMLFYGRKETPQKVPGYHYDLTALGRQVSRPSEHLYTSGTHLEFCYAVPEVDEVIRFTLPADAFGMTITRVTYTYHLAKFADWAKEPAFVKAEHLEQDLSLAKQPKEDSMELILTSDGWRNHP